MIYEPNYTPAPPINLEALAQLQTQLAGITAEEAATAIRAFAMDERLDDLWKEVERMQFIRTIFPKPR